VDGRRTEARAARNRLVCRLEVHRSHLAATILLQFIADALILVQRDHAGAFNGRDVNEGVAAAIVRRNEAIALVSVEELDGAVDAHGISFKEGPSRVDGPVAAEADEGRRGRKAP